MWGTILLRLLFLLIFLVGCTNTGPAELGGGQQGEVKCDDDWSCPSGSVCEQLPSGSKWACKYGSCPIGYKNCNKDSMCCPVATGCSTTDSTKCAPTVPPTSPTDYGCDAGQVKCASSGETSSCCDVSLGCDKLYPNLCKIKDTECSNSGCLGRKCCYTSSKGLFGCCQGLWKAECVIDSKNSDEFPQVCEYQVDTAGDRGTTAVMDESDLGPCQATSMLVDPKTGAGTGTIKGNCGFWVEGLLAKGKDGSTGKCCGEICTLYSESC